MTPEQIEREREAFQKWASDTLIIPSFYFDRAPGVDGEYDRKGTQMRWEAWLARAQSERVVGVGELEAFIDAMEVSTVVPTANSTAEWEGGYRSGVNIACDELRILIAKAEVGHG